MPGPRLVLPIRILSSSPLSLRCPSHPLAGWPSSWSPGAQAFDVLNDTLCHALNNFQSILSSSLRTLQAPHHQVSSVSKNTEKWVNAIDKTYFHPASSSSSLSTKFHLKHGEYHIPLKGIRSSRKFAHPTCICIAGL